MIPKAAPSKIIREEMKKLDQKVWYKHIFGNRYLATKFKNGKIEWQKEVDYGDHQTDSSITS